MARVRIMGPRDQLPSTLEVLQDFGRVQLDRIPAGAGLDPIPPGPRVARDHRALKRMVDDSETAISLLGVDDPGSASGANTNAEWPRCARLARRARRKAERLVARRQGLDAERTLLAKY